MVALVRIVVMVVVRAVMGVVMGDAFVGMTIY